MILYNDNDRHCQAWLEELVKQGHLPAGRVDGRPIEELQPDDLEPTSHFFAGIGGWPLALEMAGWTGPVWSGSCPCQPFSAAGKRKGTDDERHVWPAWLRLIAECRPPTIFGEQVSSRLGREWLAGVRADLEALGYAVGAADLCAASVGAPHIRQRLFWVADSRRSSNERGLRPREAPSSARETQGEAQQRERGRDDAGVRIDAGGVGNADSPIRRQYSRSVPQEEAQSRSGRLKHGDLPYGPWAASELLPCSDGKLRRTQPGIHPLAHGVPNRGRLLRGYGNAIVPQVAATFVRAFMDTRQVEENND